MPALKIEIQDHIATITLDRPPVNAVNRDTFHEIRDAFQAFRDNADVRVVIFTAAGSKAFIAGVDLKQVDDLPAAKDMPSVALDRGRPVREAMSAIGECPVPVICAVNGVALGAGAALAAMADIIVAAEGAEFGMPEINVGLLGGFAHLQALVGHYRARSMYFTGERISVDELHTMGVVRSVVPADKVQAEARSLAAEIAKKSPIAVRLGKEAMVRIDGLPLMQAYRLEQEYTNRLLRFEDASESRRAREEKREPRWQYR